MSEQTAAAGGIIRQMPDQLANQIAAGEVVQRPASVAKELLENAIDAGAGRVHLIIKDAGSTLVQVVDDGCGMNPTDAVQCFQRHATSKIRSFEDLERIRTLGFRGEALASIAAVAQVELKTRQAEDPVGFRVRIEGGEVAAEEPCAAPVGTSMEVRNLFYNVPARRNFLKTPATELKHLTETFQRIALSYPQVSFRCLHNGHALYDLPATEGDFFAATRRRILDLFGTVHEGELVPVADESSYLSVRGLVGRPAFNRKTRGEQFLFVNGRYVHDRYLSHAVRTAYGNMLPDGSFPFFALFMDMDPAHVDVNVHPTKAEVKFDDESGLYSFLRSAVRQGLGQANLTPQFEKETRTDASPEEGENGATESTSSGGTLSSGTPSGGPRPPAFRPGGGFTATRSSPSSTQGERKGNTDRSSASHSGSSAPSRSASPRRSARPLGDASDALYRPFDEGATSEQASSLAADERAAADEAHDTALPRESAATVPREVLEAGLPDAKQPLWTVHDTYITTPTADGLVLIDQRAAHARILYERALLRLKERRGESQQLLFPHTFDVPPADADVFEELLPDLRALGYDVERMSGHTVVIRGIPAGVRESEGQATLEHLLEEYKQHQNRVGEKRQKRLAARLAQQNAVRRGQSLSDEECRRLVRDLMDCEMPYADPAGHPTMVKLSLEELAKRFGR